MHLDDAQLQTLADGELAAAEEAEARGHVAVCADCHSRLADIERRDVWMWAQLQRLDHPLPAGDASALVSRAARGATLRRWGRRAAGIAIAAAVAGTAWAVPGSPVRGWLRGLVGRAAVQRPTGSSETGGIAVDPGERLTIVLAARPRAGSVVVTLSDRSRVEARCPEGTATFTADVDRLVIDLGESGAACAIAVPRRAPWVAIEAGDRRVFLKDGERITAAGPQDSTGAYVVPLQVHQTP